MSTIERVRENSDDLQTQGMNKNILIVDDEEDLTWSISKTLSRHERGFNVMCAHNGDEALTVLTQRAVDVVISDIRMPGRDGLQLMHEIKAHYPSTKIIIMTAYGSQETRKQIAARGNVFYIEKPFEIRSLHRLIHEALELNSPEDKDFSSPDLVPTSEPFRFNNLFLQDRRDNYSGLLNAALLLA